MSGQVEGGAAVAQELYRDGVAEGFAAEGQAKGAAVGASAAGDPAVGNRRGSRPAGLHVVDDPAVRSVRAGDPVTEGSENPKSVGSLADSGLDDPAPGFTVRSGIAFDLDATGPLPDVREDAETLEAAKRLREGRLGYRIFKRAFDVAFSACVLVCLSWLFAVIALAVKLDDPSGPVFFRQRRVGRSGKDGEPSTFDMYKFRSMVPDAESRLAELKAMNEKTGPVFKMREDPRVTRVGRVLRKTSLDELPQFINVLKGDISVVGPRPALPREVATYDAHQALRLLVKPGITCFWQTRRNRDSITFDEWVDLDLLYVRKCGVKTDAKLIVQTVGCVLTAQGS